jgi:perosamine synthetase
MEAITALADRHGLAVVEDAAHALPAADRGRRIGSIGDVTVFSFYANKTLTTAEGGMITTSDPDLANRARILGLHGMHRDAWKRFRADGTWDYAVVAAGFKYNLPDVLAAIGCRQLDRVEQMAVRRRAIFEAYDEAFAAIPEVAPLGRRSGVEHAAHLYVLRLDTAELSIDRAEFIRRLGSVGIGTSVHYRPLHLHPLYRDRFGYSPEDLPTATALFPRLVTLPVYPSMSDAAVATVVDAVESTVRNARI